MPKGDKDLRPTYRAECAKICKINEKSWDRLIRIYKLKPDGYSSPKHKWFYRWRIIEYSKRLKHPGPGLPIILDKK